jgi:hypothetical protein
MTLLHPVKALCAKLARNPRWKALFARHGLNLAAADLAKALQKPLAVDRSLVGFDDFADDGRRAIEPGSPSRSLLYHALASPNVVTAPDGIPLDLFPTPADLDAVENYIFGVNTPSLDDLRARFPKQTLTVVVFACEYRPAPQTCHGRHADLVFARTGVARVGTRPARYVPEFRGFHPEVSDDLFGIAVSPARYVAYLAVQAPGSEPDPGDPRPVLPQEGDSRLRFWIPVHKLFDGRDCLRGLDLKLTFSANHVNEKVFRAQQLLGNTPPATPPYRLNAGLADLSHDPNHGPGWLVPTVHPHLVAEAKTPAGEDVTFHVPKNQSSWATFDLWQFAKSHTGPEYIHARTEVLPGGGRKDLNDDLQRPDVEKRVRQGGYEALHYVDFTADGWVTATCEGLEDGDGVDAKARPAYSLVAAPDFFPSCDQRELTEWALSNAVPQKLRKQIWSTAPTPLCDRRIAANLRLPKSPFKADDKTISALVGLPLKPAHSPNPKTEPARRHSHLPDDAAGVFFPGWDVGRDRMDVDGKRVEHLAAYGLGSPFPEDAKLCAALSTFWPAAAPDVTRTMDTAQDANLSGTVAPLTDAEIGRVGGLPWDGVPGPVEIVDGGQPFAEYNSFVHTDYVRNALADKFSLRLIAKVDLAEYTNRVLAMAYGYLALGVERSRPRKANPALKALAAERKGWVVLSFTELLPGDPERAKAARDTGVILHGSVYRITVFQADGAITPANFRKRRLPIQGRLELISAPADRVVLLQSPNEVTWRQGVVKLV